MQLKITAVDSTTHYMCAPRIVEYDSAFIGENNEHEMVWVREKRDGEGYTVVHHLMQTEERTS